MARGTAFACCRPSRRVACGDALQDEAENVSEAAMAELAELTAREAATALREGDVSAERLAEALLARCAAAASLNAFISLDPDRVRAAARRADQHRQRGAR